MFGNKYTQAVLVFLSVLGIFYIYESFMVPPVTESVPQSVETSEVAEPAMEEKVDYTGTHIMPNGDVMLGTGEVVGEAEIKENSTVIIMPDGTVLTDVMDMR